MLGRLEEITAGLYLLKENIAAAGHFIFYHIKYLYWFDIAGHLGRMMLPDCFIFATHIALTYLDFLA